ncbi:MAG: GNAT family N-acetyltransferase [Acidobacteriales bacterium]|nr:GNAT family N-acetyltransferase [Terriglobales bacterium]
MKASVRFLERELGVCHLELITPSLDGTVMRGLGFIGHPLFTYRVPLFPDQPEQVLVNMDKKTRNQVRKAQKLNLVVRMRDDPPFVDEFYSQMKDVFARRGKSVPFGRDRVGSCFRHMQAAGNLLALSVHMPRTQQCIASGIFFVEGRELTLWGWTHRHEFGWYCPTEILTWTAMQKGMTVGCTTLDMSGGGEAKAKFGALPDQGNYRWMRSRYKAIRVLREMAGRTYRMKQKWIGRVAGTRLTKPEEGSTVKEHGGAV